MKLLSLVSAIALFALPACGHYSEDLASLENKLSRSSASAQIVTAPHEIAPAAGGAFYSGETLNVMLAREYLEMAKYENEKAYDYKAAKQYTKKARQASDGQLVVPFKLSGFSIPPEHAAELTQAREALIGALKTQNIPENHAALARAQVSYDCWVERAEEAADETHYASCRDAFHQSMAALAAPAAGVAGDDDMPAIYGLSFAPNTASMDAQTVQLVDSLAQFLAAPENADYTADITGYVKTQGEFGVNIVNARLGVIRDTLISRGVEPSRINASIAPASAPLTMAAEGGQPDMQFHLKAPPPVPQNAAVWR